MQYNITAKHYIKVNKNVQTILNGYLRRALDSKGFRFVSERLL